MRLVPTCLSAAPLERKEPLDGRVWIALFAIIAIAVCIRVAQSDYSFSIDGIASLKFAEVPLDRLWSNWMLRETNPPLYYSLLRLWIGIFGDGNLAVRGLSILIGSAGIFMIFLVGRHMGGNLAGLLAAALAGFSAAHLKYSLEPRGYILAYTGALVAIYGMLRFCRDMSQAAPRRTALLCYFAGTLIAVYSHTTLILLPFIVNLPMVPWLAFRQKGNAIALAEWFGVQILLLIAWAWWGHITFLQILHPVTIAWIRPPTLLTALADFRQVFVPGLLGFALFFAALLVMVIKYRRSYKAFIPLIALILPLLLFLLSQKSPAYLPRTIFWATGPFIASVAVGLCAIKNRKFAAVLALLCIGISLRNQIVSGKNLETEAWARMVDTVRKEDPEATMVSYGATGAFALQHYCRRPACRLQIYTVKRGGEAWSRDFPVPNAIAVTTLPVLLTQKGSIYISARLMPKDRRKDQPFLRAPTDAKLVDYGPALGLKNNINLVRWQRNPA